MEEAEEYEPPQTKNIADLGVVDLGSEVKEEKDVEFPYKYIEKDNERYRVPITVIKSIKALKEDKKDLRFVKVKRTGEGLKTEYTVIPVQ